MAVRAAVAALVVADGAEQVGDHVQPSQALIGAVVKLGPGRRYEIDLDYCKGCGICAAECPCGATDVVPERI